MYNFSNYQKDSLCYKEVLKKLVFDDCNTSYKKIYNLIDEINQRSDEISILADEYESNDNTKYEKKK